MRNIIAIFKRDLSRIRGSVVALIVAVGLVIVPTLYAWFNIAGSWDPYGNTGNLKVAVANSDDGYMSDLIPVRVNIGDTVVSALRENDQLDWRFVSESDAVEGVRSGEYYAAVVIPENFSSRMMTVFSSDAEHAEIVYYENQKANAIAPRVTDKAASTVRQQIDETFAKTISDVGLATTSSSWMAIRSRPTPATCRARWLVPSRPCATLLEAWTSSRDCCSHPPACSIRRAICWRAPVRRTRMPRPLWATRKRA